MMVPVWVLTVRKTAGAVNALFRVQRFRIVFNGRHVQTGPMTLAHVLRCAAAAPTRYRLSNAARAAEAGLKVEARVHRSWVASTQHSVSWTLRVYDWLVRLRTSGAKIHGIHPAPR